jgi:hypothetical protein
VGVTTTLTTATISTRSTSVLGISRINLIAMSVFPRNYNYNAPSVLDRFPPTHTMFLSSTKAVNEFAVHPARYYSCSDFQRNKLSCLTKTSVTVIRTLLMQQIRCFYHTPTRHTHVILTDTAEVCLLFDQLHTERQLCAHVQQSWPKGLQQTLL